MKVLNFPSKGSKAVDLNLLALYRQIKAQELCKLLNANQTDELLKEVQKYEEIGRCRECDSFFVKSHELQKYCSTACFISAKM